MKKDEEQEEEVTVEFDMEDLLTEEEMKINREYNAIELQSSVYENSATTHEMCDYINKRKELLDKLPDDEELERRARLLINKGRWR